MFTILYGGELLRDCLSLLSAHAAFQGEHVLHDSLQPTGEHTEVFRSAGELKWGPPALNRAHGSFHGLEREVHSKLLYRSASRLKRSADSRYDESARVEFVPAWVDPQIHLLENLKLWNGT